MARPLSIDDTITILPRREEDVVEQITKGDAIVRAITLGAPRDVAARAAGVDPATFYRWVAAGAEVMEMSDDELDDKQRRLRQFCEDVSKADAQAVVYAVEVVSAAMPTSWQAAMTWLERRYPGEWGRRIEVKTDPTNREPALVDTETAAAAAEAFTAAALPPGLSPDDFLPALTEGGE